MSSRQLPADATATSIVDSLDEPEEYIRGMLANLHEANKIEKASRVTIGVTGKGIVPNYKIDAPVDLFGGGKLLIHMPKLVFNGRTHKQMFDPAQVQGENWSTQSNTIEELKAKIGELRSTRANRRSRRPI